MPRPPFPFRETSVQGARTRQWSLTADECPELAAHGIARLGLDAARPPYARVRLRPAGSFFLAAMAGEGHILLEGRWQKLRAGALCMAPPRVLNAFYASTPARWTFAWLRYDEPPPMQPLVGAASPLRLEKGAEELERALGGLRAEWLGERDPALVHHWVSLLHGTARRLARPWRASSRMGHLWDQIGLELDADWKLPSLAQRARVSAEHLRRLCRRELGRTPMEHLTYMRIQRAQELLETTGDKLETIALQVGYRSATVFSRAFTRCVGLMPSEYRTRKEAGRG